MGFKIFKNGDAVRTAADEIKRLADDRHGQVMALLKAVDAGESDAALAARAAIKDVDLRIGIAERQLEAAKRASAESRRDELPALRDALDQTYWGLLVEAMRDNELAARRAAASRHPDLAERIRTAGEADFFTSFLVPDALKRAREAGKALADEVLRETPLPPVDAMRQEIRQLDEILSGNGYALKSAVKREISKAVRADLTVDQMDQRAKARQRAERFSKEVQ
jgi:hypothetical protein